MARNLYLEYYKDPGVSGNVYALVFAPNSTALKLSAGTWTLQTYLASSHSAFAIALAEHSQRSRFWRAQLNEGVFTLPDNDEGAVYTVELWAEASVGVQNRSADTFLGSYTFSWAAVESAHNMAHCYVSYDSAMHRMGLLAWLEIDGELIEDPSACLITVYDSAGAALFTVTSSSPDAAGQFNLEKTSLTLSPDEIYFVKCTITAADEVTQYKGGSSISTWD